MLLEKPFTVTIEEATEVIKAERKSGKILSIGFQPRFDANMQMVKKIAESGVLGKIYYIQTGVTAPVPSSQIFYNQAVIDGIIKFNKLGKEVEIKLPEC